MFMRWTCVIDDNNYYYMVDMAEEDYEDMVDGEARRDGEEGEGGQVEKSSNMDIGDDDDPNPVRSEFPETWVWMLTDVGYMCYVINIFIASFMIGVSLTLFDEHSCLDLLAPFIKSQVSHVLLVFGGV